MSESATLPDKWIIRTHDRLNFKTCREKWNFNSPLRMDLEALVRPKPLDFGTAFHSAAEVLYDPMTWNWDREVVEARAVQKFNEVCGEHKKQHIKVNGDLAYEIETDFQERKELGEAMLKQYFKWARVNDAFRPLMTEIEFEVPIPVALDTPLPANFMARWNDEYECFQLYYLGRPVVYQGKVDLLLEDVYGRYWIDDHKTAAQASSLQWLEMDDQIGSYVWALRKALKLPIVGFLYTEVFKKILHPPNVNKNGSLSVNKQQDTSYELFMQALKEHNLDPSAYTSFLEYLKENPKQTVRRSDVLRNERQLVVFERRLLDEVIDMLDNPRIYPNPSKMSCNGCWFYDPCLAKQEDGDVEFITKELFQKRERTNA